MNKNIFMVTVAMMSFLIAGYFLVSHNADNSTQTDVLEDKAIDEQIEIEEVQPKTQIESDSPEANTTTSNEFKGTILAESSSPYIEFNQSDYNKAVNDGKVIYLEFYADWCPTCRAQEPDLIEGFNVLTTDNVVGFKVNYKDSSTDDIEKELAKKHNVSYQHTKVILVEGNEVINKIDTWDSEDIVENLNQY